MNAMLEPRMVAARIQVRALATTGVAASPDRIEASSLGGLMAAADGSNHEYLAILGWPNWQRS
jgi:hypothetical protein